MRVCTCHIECTMDLEYANPILDVGGIGIKMALSTGFVKIISYYKTIKRPKC